MNSSEQITPSSLGYIQEWGVDGNVGGGGGGRGQREGGTQTHRHETDIVGSTLFQCLHVYCLTHVTTVSLAR